VEPVAEEIPADAALGGRIVEDRRDAHDIRFEAASSGDITRV